MGYKGDKMRLFLTDSRIRKGPGEPGQGIYQNKVTMRRCIAGNLRYDHKDREIVAELKTVSKTGGKSAVPSPLWLTNRTGAWMFSHAKGMGEHTDGGNHSKINTFQTHEEGGIEAWQFFVLKRPVITRSCQTIILRDMSAVAESKGTSIPDAVPARRTGTTP